MVSEKMTANDSAILAERGRFMVKIAETPGELLEAQRLRYRVFKSKNGEPGVDSDIYDRFFTHLLVIDRESRRIAGTYRMQSGTDAMRGIGFYSASEYDLPGLNRIAYRTWELGRSCVAPEYRNGAVIALLWSGINAMRRREHFRYLTGCGSIKAEPAGLELGWAMYDYFLANGFTAEFPLGTPRAGFRLPKVPEETRKWWQRHPAELQRALPPLFKGYLRAGAKIAGAPAWDRSFGTVDFLIIFDFEEIAERYARHFEIQRI